MAIVSAVLSACAGDENQGRELPTLVVLGEGADGDARPAPVALADVPLTGLLNFWEAARGRLSAGQPDVWSFVGQAGDAVIVRAIGRNGDVTMMLQTEDGQILGSGTRIEVELHAGGIYTVIVTAGDENAVGDYEIGLAYADRPNPAEITSTPLPEVVGVPTPIPVYAELGTFITRLNSGNTVGGTIERAGENHIYTFDGNAGDYAQVEMNRVSGEIDPLVTLYDPTGVPLATDDESGGGQNAILRNIRLPVDGLYSVQATTRTQPGTYSIRVLKYAEFAPVTPTVVNIPTETPIPTPTALTPAAAEIGARLEDHVPVLGMLSPGGVAIHSFTLEAGEIVTVGVSPVEGSALRPEIDISNPEGVIIAVASSSTAGADGEAFLTALRADIAGAYSVFIRGENDSFGAYSVSFGRGSTRQDVLQGSAAFDTRNEGAISRRGFRDVWTLELRQGDIITATVNPGVGSALDPILELVPASDSSIIIAIDVNSGGDRSPLIRRAEIPETGLYLLRIRASQAATTGAYALIWRYINVAPTPTAPPASAPVLIRRDEVADQQYGFYPFQGRAGQRLFVRVLAVEGSGFDPVAALIGPNGDVLVEVDDVGDDLNPSFVYELPADGTYNIRVNGYLAGGPFTVIVEELF
jgi:hypothetical protein